VGATVHDEPWPLFYSFLILLWHVNALPGIGSINTPRYTHQQWNNGVMQLASRQRVGKHTSERAQWRHTPTVLNYHVICFLCGLRYATVELCFLCCPCGAYITNTCCSGLNLEVVKLTCMVCSAKPVLTEDLCVVQKQEFFNNMLYVRNVHTTKGQAHS
jgi:hypothetical protein